MCKVVVKSALKHNYLSFDKRTKNEEEEAAEHTGSIPSHRPVQSGVQRKFRHHPYELLHHKIPHSGTFSVGRHMLWQHYQGQ